MTSEQLFYDKKTGFDRLTEADRQGIQTYAEGYKTFLDEAKTERDAVKEIARMAEAKGFRAWTRDDTLKTGDKIYRINRHKGIMLAVIGEKSLAEGVRLTAAHLDAPRVDIRTVPLYEDNGNDKHYASEYATTLLTKRTLNDSTIAVTVGARKGTYKDMPANRHYTLKLVASTVPASVQIDGVETPFAYDGNNLSVLIDIAETDCTKEKTVTVTFPKNAAPVADGLIGKFRHIQQGCIAIKSRTPGFLFNEQLGTMESTGVAISYAPQEAAERIEAFRRNYANLKQVLVESGMEEAEADKFVQKAY